MEAAAMPSGPTFVIVGASLGGARAAGALRDEGFEGQIVLIGAEAHYPYERPPLSKGYLQGREERQSMFVHDDGWYAEHAIDLRLGTEVTAIDPNLRQVGLASGETVGYDKLLLTTGAVPRRLPVPGAGAHGVMTLRTVDDSDRLRETLASASRIAVIGAGWIGLEVAAAARIAGVAVTVIEAAELPLLGVLGPEVAQVFLDLHREHDVDFRPRRDGDQRGRGRRRDRCGPGHRSGRGRGPRRRRRRPHRCGAAHLRPGHLRRR
jgi:3-phenylpropionate/trans-cinnamate dioxygenase ferredoxin reductase subunit